MVWYAKNAEEENVYRKQTKLFLAFEHSFYNMNLFDRIVASQTVYASFYF